MKSFIKLLIVSVLLIFFQSCEDVIKLETPYAGERIVIEASIDWEKGTKGNTQIVKLSYSKPYFNNDTDSFVIGASVKIIIDDNGQEFVFEDQKDGTYLTDEFLPVLGKVYTLEINHNGKKYQAKEQFVKVPDINKVDQLTITGFGDDQKMVEAFFDDNPQEENFYLGVFALEGFLPELKVGDDSFSNGNENKIRFSNEDLKQGDKVNIKLYGISKRYHSYIKLLAGQAGQGGGRPFQATPSRLYGNCKNVNDPEEEVLGYFRLTQYIETTYTIK